ncbi:MAG: helix-turn-helix domain-containing protein, partial [Propionibacteriaceae bacterium]|nr:helix-turn-helix domain-containing protein [Propionibacteriaceae bacterium]
MSTTRTPAEADLDRPASLIGRVIRTLELLGAQPMTAAELGRELGTNRSTALRLLAQMVETGYVTRDVGT